MFKFAIQFICNINQVSIYLLCVLLLYTVATHGQKSDTEKIFVKGEFYNKPLIEWIKELESLHPIHFHYVNDVVEGVRLNGILKFNTPLPQAMEILFGDTQIAFVIQNDNQQIVLYKSNEKVLKPSAKMFTLSGVVVDHLSRQPLPFVSVFLPGFSKAVVSNEEGKFEIKPLPPGTYLANFSFVGYAPVTKKISINDVDVVIEVPLEENVMQLKELEISPSKFEISTVETTPLVLGKAEILHSPNMSKDIYRTLRTLPGIANSDYSSKARVRGGHSEETSVYLDHFLINEPFHLEEVDGTFSIFNTDYIDELTVLTGGFSAKYADRLSGVIDVKTFDHLEADKYSFSADLMNLSFLAQQKLTDKVNISINARRGYLDFLLKKMGTDDTDQLEPRYSDFWTKVTLKHNARNAFSLNLLSGRDKFTLKDEGNFAAQLNLKNIRENHNVWMNWKWFPKSTFNSITTVGYQRQDKNATFIFPESITPGNIDNNALNTFVITNNTYWDLTNRSTLELGAELRKFNGHYHYREERYDVFNSSPDNIVIQDINLVSDLNGYTAGAYVQYNWIINNLTLQPGLRTSFQSFSQSPNWAPRLAMSYKFLESLTAKLAYGIYYQPDLYFKMRTSLRQDKLYNTNGRATHYTGSLSYNKGRTNVMLNFYHKEYDHLFDDYRYEFFNRMAGVSILDIPFNTTSGYSRGVEVMVRKDYARNSNLSLSYSYAKSILRNAAGTESPRDFDQPHTVILNNTFRLPRNWNLSFLWTYHTGYPYTPTAVDFIQYRPDEERIMLFYEPGQKNSARLPSFHSLDIRMEKSWHIRRNIICAYLNIVNFYKRDNIRSYWWSAERERNGMITFDSEQAPNIPFFVSPGIAINLY